MKKWNQLPADQKKAVIPAAKNHDYKLNVPPIDPSRDKVFEVQSRALTQNAGKLSRWNSQGKVGGLSTLGHLWIKQQEWDSFIKQINGLELNQKIVFPNRITHRIARFHLVDNTRGEGPAWRMKDIKTAVLFVTRTSKGYQIQGDFHLENTTDKRSYMANLTGLLTLANKQPKSWTMTVYGKHQGEGRFTRNARPGAQPLAFTFEYLAKPEDIRPVDLVPPQHMRWQRGYWEAEKH